jgi:Tol biopolymer transport system component
MYPGRRICQIACVALVVGACSADEPNTAAEQTATSETSVAQSTTTEPVPMAIAAGEPWIVYEAPFYERDHDVGNRLVRPDGSDDHWATPQVPLPRNGWQVHPDWNPDGSLLAFAADDPSGEGKAPELQTRDLWVSRPDGTEAERLIDCDLVRCVEADYPAWSPDGNTLAFRAIDDAGGENANLRLALMDMNTRDITTVALAPGADAYAGPRWAPDGQRMVLWVERWTDSGPDATLTATALAVVDLRDPQPTATLITDWSMWANYPDWHPTEDLIVFSTRPWDALDDGPSNLYTVRPDGTGLTQVTDFAKGETRAVQPTWTPDGEQVIFTAVEGLGFGEPTMAIIDRDGTGLQSATSSGPMFGTHPRLRPGT